MGERNGDAIRGRVRGSLLAGAVGDALGAPVEFLSLAEIRARCGAEGVTGFLPAYGRSGGAITDDTQMTLFTAEGIIRSLVRQSYKGICHPPSVVLRSYWRWLTTQGEPWPSAAAPPDADDGWLVGVEALHQRRAPGNTCLSALRRGELSTSDTPVNNSKGCGGVMRAAPIGLTGVEDSFELAKDCAALTHGHPSGYLSAGFLAEVIRWLIRGHDLNAALDTAERRCRRESGADEVLEAVEVARDLAAAGPATPERVEQLGAGWVAEEALAIGVYCALAGDGLADSLLLAVNHSGDSDSTGSITGNLLGALHGDAAIPSTLLDDLELVEVIEAVADDLHDAFHGEGVGGEYAPRDDTSERWWSRYPGF